jgi:glycosyltransferase involved in cell wall biosynthesis
MKPRVSVIMPVLNGKKYIAEAIRSILAQTHPCCELIVVDDGSTDGTREQVAPFMDQLHITYISHAACRGIPQSMNDGVRHAKGNLIAFLDHDDAWLPEFLENQVAYLDSHPDVAMVHSDFQTIDFDGNVIEESVAACRQRARPSGNVFRQLFMDSFIVGNSVLIREECFARLGLFDESLRWGDYHMWMRIARHYNVDYTPKVLTKYRQHPTQSTRSVSISRPDEDSVALMAIKKIIEIYPEIRTELGEKTIRRRMASLYFDVAYTWFCKDAMLDARIFASRAIWLWPTNPRYLRLYLASLLRPSHAKALRRGWRRLRNLSPSRRVDSDRLDRVANIG